MRDASRRKQQNSLLVFRPFPGLFRCIIHVHVVRLPLSLEIRLRGLYFLCLQDGRHVEDERGRMRCVSSGTESNEPALTGAQYFLAVIGRRAALSTRPVDATRDIDLGPQRPSLPPYKLSLLATRLFILSSCLPHRRAVSFVTTTSRTPSHPTRRLVATSAAKTARRSISASTRKPPARFVGRLSSVINCSDCTLISIPTEVGTSGDKRRKRGLKGMLQNWKQLRKLADRCWPVRQD